MKQKDLFMILIPSFVIVVFWIGLTIYHNSISSTIPPALNIQIKPIDPSFNTKAIAELKRRKEIIPMFEMTEIEKLQSSSSAIPILPSIPPASEGGSLIP
ncbi:MAG: hypothetical protein CO135_00710 [Candidatus Levybacteria bacterium CG_4_9_14_3_um_filter_35_16]|nr:MAG: hypothetical protein COW87_04625 [Candidatus Levybacteria bacterium CG22_combo_CG10-13_8_21_14_all_35_11]PIY94445.1 MAG: hypothetical protein COY68_02700 [Candidatus Levybacteria bacterium CG_4_10_14_0_8_um_filter_35_23]PJA91540.1 MAG: hypothetical protein CO135_00710 [Candidatus Levybacteria bacterium CG_4_9_14_3_um_filter_35_16]PJC54566.1 MAG: hypothetical protein CO028_01785 [Candidatus Levybacteria bacterium CG_4_9_14_0_2_um_filter_35_21]